MKQPLSAAQIKKSAHHGEKSVQLSVLISSALRERFVQTARAEGKTAAQVIREMVESYCEDVP